MRRSVAPEFVLLAIVLIESGAPASSTAWWIGAPRPCMRGVGPTVPAHSETGARMAHAQAVVEA